MMMNNKYETELLNHLSESNQIKNHSKVILFIIVFLTILISLSYFISYPDKISGKIYLLSDSTPNTIYSPNSGNIKLLVKDNELVEKDDLLAFITTDTSFEDVLYLKKEISNLDIKSPTLSDNLINHKMKLGSLENPFHDFILSYNEYLIFKKNNLNELNKKRIKDNVNYLKNELDITNKYLLIQNNKNKITKDIFKDDSIFFKDKIIHKEKYNNSLLNNLDIDSKKHLDLNNYNSINKEIKDKINQVSILNEDYKKQEDQLLLNLHKSYLNLKSSINNWEYNYLIKSPINGTLEFTQIFINNSQYINKNTPLFIILPKYNKIEGKGIVSPHSYAKIKLKDSIVIKLDNYPFQEYGTISGIVNRKSNVLNDSVYTIHIGIDKNMTTSFKKNIQYSYNMSGKMEYYTDKTTIMDKIFFFLKSLKKY